MKKVLFAIILCLFPAVLAARPNIILIMVDDLGFADFGCYGSEIETPWIDRLARGGLRFSQFYNNAKCETSRISLMTGLYPNQAGGRSLSRANTVAMVLKEAGYATSMTGKWHLWGEPTDFGFDRYMGHLSGATDFFVGNDSFRLNGEEWDGFDADFYTTDAFVDYAIRFLDESLETGKPFFHYIAFNAPHYPLQAPKADIEKYLGRYDAGWKAIREARFSKQQAIGLFDASLRLPPMPEHIPAWDSLDAHRKRYEAFRMAVYAAMVDRVDRNIGRLVDYLKTRGVFENTLILILSDNGGCPFERSRNLEIPPWRGESFYLYDASWAAISNTPLRHYKQTQHEGGISSPFIVHWPGRVENAGGWERGPAHLIDIMATLIEIGGAEYPAGPEVAPLQGKSLLPLFDGRKRTGHDDLYFRFNNCRALRHGEWKAVSFYGHAWELYNIAEDRMEQHDLAAAHPEVLSELVGRWHWMAREVDGLPEDQAGPAGTGPSPHDRDSWHGPERWEEWEMPRF